MTAKWSKERAWAWYHARPWIRGCNFMGSDCANRIDQWQAYDFDKHLETAKRELALAAETGFNSIRIIPEYYVCLLYTSCGQARERAGCCTGLHEGGAV